MQFGMVADLKALVVKLPDLPPGHVDVFPRRKREGLTDKERGIEAMLLEQWRDNRCMTLAGVVKRQHDSLLLVILLVSRMKRRD
jgi:hypothetical protein